MNSTLLNVSAYDDSDHYVLKAPETSMSHQHRVERCGLSSRLSSRGLQVSEERSTLTKPSRN